MRPWLPLAAACLLLAAGAACTGGEERADSAERCEPRVAWGNGDDQVSQAVGVNRSAEWFPNLPADDPQRTAVRGDPAIAIPVGDPPVGQITIGWSSNGCDYTVWVEPGLTLDEAIAYAQRY